MSCSNFNNIINFSGFDVGSVINNIGTASECQNRCKFFVNCKFFTWTSNDTRCRLKSQIGRIIVVRNSVSGPNECPAKLSHYDIRLVDHSIAGYEFKGTVIQYRFGVSYSDQCHFFCLNTDGCSYWNYYKNLQTCYLYEKTTLELVKNSLCVFGYKLSFDCFERGIANPGNDIGAYTTNIKSASSCQQWCQALKDCQFWTFDSAQLRCYRKTKSAVTKTIHPNRLSGPRHCTHRQLEPFKDTLDCSITSLDYYGDDIDLSTQVLSARACQELCQNHQDCHYWTYFKNSFVCYRKRSKGIPTYHKGNQNIVSGPKKCNSNFKFFHLLN